MILLTRSMRSATVASTLVSAYNCLMEILRAGDKEAVKFVTPSGVTGVVATSLSSDLIAKMARKLTAKLKRSGHLADQVPAGTVGHLTR